MRRFAGGAGVVSFRPMEVLTAIVGFMFVCIVFPNLVKNRPQFYSAFGLVVLILLLRALAAMFGSAGFSNFIHVVNEFMTIGALVLVVLATGGISLRELGGEFKNAFEVIRRGESEKEVIVPLMGEMPKPRKRPEPEMGDLPIAPAVTAEKKPEDTSGIPLA